MLNTSSISILHFEAGDITLPLQNDNCPIWVEGSPSVKNNSILKFNTELYIWVKHLVENLQFTDTEIVAFNDTIGVAYRLSFTDVEMFKTMNLNYLLPPWQEARLGSDDVANGFKAVLVWIAYWTDYAINKGVTPYLYLGSAN